MRLRRERERERGYLQLTLVDEVRSWEGNGGSAYSMSKGHSAGVCVMGLESCHGSLPIRNTDAWVTSTQTKLWWA